MHQQPQGTRQRRRRSGFRLAPIQRGGDRSDCRETVEAVGCEERGELQRVGPPTEGESGEDHVERTSRFAESQPTDRQRRESGKEWRQPQDVSRAAGETFRHQQQRGVARRPLEARSLEDPVLAQLLHNAQVPGCIRCREGIPACIAREVRKLTPVGTGQKREIGRMQKDCGARDPYERDPDPVSRGPRLAPKSRRPVGRARSHAADHTLESRSPGTSSRVPGHAFHRVFVLLEEPAGVDASNPKMNRMST